MSFVRSLNRLLNKISFLVSHYILFLYNGKIRVYKQEPLDGELVSNHADTINEYAHSVIPDSDAAESLAKFLDLDKMSKPDKIQAILAFIHSMPYTRDEKHVSGDDVKTLYGSLRTCKMDCEDSAVCITTMLIRCGMHAHLIFLERPKGSSDTNHCMACISEDDLDNPSGAYKTRMGKRYYLIEGTAEKKVGELNKKYRNWNAYVIDCSEVA